MLHEPTVSRDQALIEDVGGGIFCMENKSSANVTKLNGRSINRTRLDDGDIVTMGEQSLRFSKSA